MQGMLTRGTTCRKSVTALEPISASRAAIARSSRPPAANQLVERLVAVGILVEITGQARNRRFRYDAYVSLFDESDDGRHEGTE